METTQWGLKLPPQWIAYMQELKMGGEQTKMKKKSVLDITTGTESVCDGKGWGLREAS